MSAPPARIALLTLLALLAFAANSILCRLALAAGHIDAAGFTVIRLLAGALALIGLVALRPGSGNSIEGAGGKPDGWAATLLFAYAAAFSFAYLSLDAGPGALILFAAVQVTMILVAVVRGERPRPFEWLGLVLAFGGLVYLVGLGEDVAAQPLPGVGLMAVAGAAWGGYTLRGGRSADPLRLTRDNFVLALPWALALSALAWGRLEVSTLGVLWAALSGALTSGVGYAVWYSALRGLSATRAAIVQLTVPLLAALGGILLLGEHLTLRLVVSAILILGGVSLALRARQTARRPATA